MAEAKTAYDEVVYESHSFPQSHPDRLAAIASLFGMKPPPIETARVLELGCAGGGNLVPMAVGLPEARFVGVDASAKQVAQGRELIERLGITNVELKTLDIADVGDDFGTFDYIVTHGVYSWVPPAIQDKIIAIARDRLAPNGVAYISYNTFPGWHIRGIVRDMMLFHGKQFADPPTQVGQAKALVEFVAASVPAEGNAYIQLLKSEFDLITKVQASYLYHDHLEDYNQPLYFHEFAKKLAAKSLQYLGETEFPTMVASNFSPQIAQTLQRLGANDIVQMEQYMDYVRCRFFRQTLVCHKNIPLKRNLGAEDVKGFWFSTPARREKENEPIPFAPRVPVEFKLPSGANATVTGSVCKAAMATLVRLYPSGLAFPELLRVVRGVLSEHGVTPGTPEAVENELARDLLTCMAMGAIEFRRQGLNVATSVGPKPRATALARHQAAQPGSATNLRGESIRFDDLGRLVLRQLDGMHDRTDLVEAVCQSIAVGGLVLRQGEVPVTDPAKVRAIIDGAIDGVLAKLVRAAMLEA